MILGTDIAEQAELLIGARWQRNGRGPHGYDCSGLVHAAATNAGLTLEDCMKYDVRCVPDGLIQDFCNRNGTLMLASARDTGLVFMVEVPGFPGVSHMGIISSYDRAIHMDASKHRVVVDSFDWLRGKCVMTMKFNGVT